MKNGALAISIVSAGFIALLAALVHLQWVFGEEREDALAAISAQENASLELVRREIRERLLAQRIDAERRLSELRAADVERPVDLYHQVGDDVLLPPPPILEGSGRLSQLLSADDWAPLLTADLEQERYRRILTLETSVLNRLVSKDPLSEASVSNSSASKKPHLRGNPAEATAALDAVLKHAEENVLGISFDAASLVRTLEAAARLSPLPSSLVQALLLEPPGPRRLAFFSRLSLERADLRAHDLEQLWPRLQTIVQTHRVSLAPLQRELAVEPPAPPPKKHSSASAPASASQPARLVSQGTRRWPGTKRWLLWSNSNIDHRGVLVDTQAVTSAVVQSLVAQNLLAHDAALVLPDGPIEPLNVELISMTFETAGRLAERRFRQKSILNLTCALLAAAALGLATLIIRRRQAILDLKTDFVATVSHELRTPLSGIRLLAETLERRLATNPQARDYPTRIVQQVDRLGFLVDNLLSFSRVDKGRWTLQLEPVDIHALIGRIENDLALQMPGCVIKNEVPTGTEIDADLDLLQLLFSNLLRNGLSYNDAATPTVVVKQNGARDFSVSDNGIGISKVEREQIFEPFVRSQDPRTAKKRGTGLGLGLCRRIVKLHHGQLVLADTGSHGSTFRLQLSAFSQRGDKRV